MNWVLILAISIPPILVVTHYINSTIPDYSAKIPGTYEPTKILRSEKAVPTIESESLDDLFFALGFTHAQDRLWQMETLRRSAEGTLSEFLGAEYIPQDIFARNMQFRENSEKLFNLSTKGQFLLQRYTQGINLYTEQHSLPIEYLLTWNKWRPWTIWDSLSIWRYLSFMLGDGYKHDLLRSKVSKVLGNSLLVMPVEERKLFEPYYTVQSNELPAELYRVKENEVSRYEETQEKFEGLDGNLDISGSSNAWVVSGEFSKSGKPIIANDPHLLSQIPCLVYLVKAKWKTEQIAGGSIPGMPAFLFGFNNKISWGVSSMMSNTVDLYSNVTIDSSFSVVVEDIKVKNGKTVQISYKCGKVGCSLYENPGIFVRWAANEVPDKSFDGYLELISSFSVRSLRKSLEKVAIPHLNIVFATVEGDIGYQATGIHPLHEQYLVGIKDGSKQNQVWKNFIAFEDLPYTLNPAKGFIVSANNYPATSIYKYFHSIKKEFSGSRASRIDDLIQSLLKKRVKISVEDMLKIQMDEFSTLAYKTLPVLLKLSNSSLVSEYFEGWDYELSKDSRQASVFINWYSGILTHLSVKIPELTESFVFRSMVAKYIEDNNIEALCLNLKIDIKSCESSIKTLALNSIQAVGQTVWGELHKVKYDHFPFDSSFFNWIFRTEVNSGGNEFTVNSKAFKYLQGYSSTFGTEARFVHDLGNWSQSLWGISTGQSGNPLSPHYKDFISPFDSGTLPNILQ